MFKFRVAVSVESIDTSSANVRVIAEIAPVSEAIAWQTRPDLAGQPDAFRGYETTTLNTQIIELLDADRRPVERLHEGEQGFVAQVLVSADEFVREGEPVIILENPELMAEVYAAREPQEEFTSAEVVSAMPNLLARYVKTLHEATDYLLEHLQSGDVVLVLSAGDADQISTALLKELKER